MSISADATADLKARLLPPLRERS